MIDLNRSYCIFRAQPPGRMPNTWRQKILCKAELYKGQKPITSCYLNYFCAGEEVYSEMLIFMDKRIGEHPYIFTTILAGANSIKSVRISTAHMNKSIVHAISEGSVFRNVRIIERSTNYTRLGNESEISASVLAGRELVGVSDYQCYNGEYRWVITYPINCINIVERKKVYQVDAGPVLFSESSTVHTRDDLFLAYIGYNNIKRNTEFLIYPDNTYPSTDKPDQTSLEIDAETYPHFLASKFYLDIKEKVCINRIYSVDN